MIELSEKELEKVAGGYPINPDLPQLSQWENDLGQEYDWYVKCRWCNASLPSNSGPKQSAWLAKYCIELHEYTYHPGSHNVDPSQNAEWNMTPEEMQLAISTFDIPSVR